VEGVWQTQEEEDSRQAQHLAMDPTKNNVEAAETTDMVEIAVLADSDDDDNSSVTAPQRYTGEVICVTPSQRAAGIIRLSSDETVGITAYWAECLTEGQWVSCRVSGSAGNREASAIRLLLRRDILVADREAHGGGRRADLRSPPRSPRGSRRSRASRQARYGLTITGAGLSAAAAGAESTEAVHTAKASDYWRTCAPTPSQGFASDVHIKAVMNMACSPLDREKTLIWNEDQQRLHVTMKAGEIDYIGMRGLEQNIECTENVQYQRHSFKGSSEPQRLDAATSCRRC
jgi:hypothetical protein